LTKTAGVLWGSGEKGVKNANNQQFTAFNQKAAGGPGTKKYGDGTCPETPGREGGQNLRKGRERKAGGPHIRGHKGMEGGVEKVIEKKRDKNSARSQREGGVTEKGGQTACRTCPKRWKRRGKAPPAET